MPRQSTLVTALLVRVSDAGRVGRVLGPQLDLLRAGPSAVRAARDGVSGVDWTVEARRAVYRRIWSGAAAALGGDVEPLGEDFLVIRARGTETVVHYHEVMLDDPVHLRLALDKPIVQRRLVRAGLPVARSVEVRGRDGGAALGFLRDIGGPCVVKPARGAGGRGVTCGVDTAERMGRARVWARRWDDTLLVEEQAGGDEYRFLFLDGRLLGIVRRRPTRLTADGISSVIELVAAENRRRAAAGGRLGISDVEVDLDCIVAAERAGFSLRATPPPGTRVPVHNTANQCSADDAEAIPPDAVTSELVSDARAAAEVTGLRLAGVDMVTPDVTRPLRAAGGVILEVNGTPGLHYHALVSNAGEAPEVAVPILEALLDGTRR